MVPLKRGKGLSILLEMSLSRMMERLSRGWLLDSLSPLANQPQGPLATENLQVTLAAWPTLLICENRASDSKMKVARIFQYLPCSEECAKCSIT